VHEAHYSFMILTWWRNRTVLKWIAH